MDNNIDSSDSSDTDTNHIVNNHDHDHYVGNSNENILNTFNVNNYMKSRIEKRKKMRMDNYDNIIDVLVNKSIPKKISKLKLEEENETPIIPTFADYKWILMYDYRINNLKPMLKYYNQKLSGNKHELEVRLYNWLLINYNSILIQKSFMRYIVKKYVKSHGPARFDRKLCVNESDFCTMQQMEDIPFKQFISFKDDSNHIYGLNILSLYNLLLQNQNKIENPYTKKLLDNKILGDMFTFIRYSKILNISIDLKFTNLSLDDENENLNLRIISVFHEINLLGNYSNSIWFNSLSRELLIRFMNELMDIWHYRANLSDQVKCEICPPRGNPFRNYVFSGMYSQNYFIIKKSCVNIIELLVKTGINHDSKALGAYYVLACLTLVNEDAATAMPWLYQSVVPVHFILDD